MMPNPNGRETVSSKRGVFAQQYPVLAVLLGIILFFAFLPLAVLTVLLSIPATICFGIPILLGLTILVPLFLTTAAILWAMYQGARWAYGAVVRVPVGSGNRATFQPAAEASAEGNDVRGYLEINLVKVDGSGDDDGKQRRGGSRGPDMFLAEKSR